MATNYQTHKSTAKGKAQTLARRAARAHKRGAVTLSKRQGLRTTATTKGY